MGILSSLFGRSPKPSQPTFTELTPDDRARLDQQREVIATVVQQRYNKPQLTKTRTDLEILQRILDDGVFKKTQTYELQCLGIVFGDALASELPLQWMIVTDEYGTDPTLCYKNTTLQLNALTMIAKRVENDDQLNVTAFFEAMHQQIENLKDTPIATR